MPASRRASVSKAITPAPSLSKYRAQPNDTGMLRHPSTTRCTRRKDGKTVELLESNVEKCEERKRLIVCEELVHGLAKLVSIFLKKDPR